MFFDNLKIFYQKTVGSQNVIKLYFKYIKL